MYYRYCARVNISSIIADEQRTNEKESREKTKKSVVLKNRSSLSSHLNPDCDLEKAATMAAMEIR